MLFKDYVEFLNQKLLENPNLNDLTVVAYSDDYEVITDEIRKEDLQLGHLIEEHSYKLFKKNDNPTHICLNGTMF